MSKKVKGLDRLTARVLPYNLSVNLSSDGTVRTQGQTSFSAKATLILLGEIKTVGERSLQPTERHVEAYGNGATMEDAQNAAVEKVIVLAGV